ncbi:MAG TPA: hypothetical protein V6D07_01145 [Trichocoleus sp.]
MTRTLIEETAPPLPTAIGLGVGWLRTGKLTSNRFTSVMQPRT